MRQQLLLYEAEQPLLQLLIDELTRIRDAARRAAQTPSGLDGDKEVTTALCLLAEPDYERSELLAHDFSAARAKVERLQSELSLLANAETLAQEQLEQLQIKVNLDHVADPTSGPRPVMGPSEQLMGQPQALPPPAAPMAPPPRATVPPLAAPPMGAPPPPPMPGGAARPPPPLAGPAKKVPTKPAVHPEVKMKVPRCPPLTLALA